MRQAAFLAREVLGARFGAAVLDAFLVVGVWLLLFLFVYPSFGFGPGAFAIRIPITVLWFIAYYALQDGGLGGTIGKMAVGLRVVDENFRPITLGKGFARSLEVLLWPLLGGLILLIIQWVLIDKNGQGIGDRFANCYVLEKSHLRVA